MRLKSLAILLAGASMSLPGIAVAQDARPSLAEPSLSPDGSMIAFSSGGDIWEVAASGGVAHLLATDPATEGRPLYSPDGRKLAFTSSRSGNTNIYVLDLASGLVTRLTFAETNEELDSWSADGKWLYFSSGAEDPGARADVFRVGATGGTPMAVSNDAYVPEFQAAPSPDGSHIALMARGISNGQWWRNGRSHIDETELWVKPVPGAGGYQRLLADNAKHAWPQWTPDGKTLFFMSDKSGTENLWRMAASGGAARQVTQFTDGRLLYPMIAANGTAIVFERDMAIWRFDPASGKAAPVEISLRGASAMEAPRHLKINNFDRMALSPDGQKVAVIGHGEIFAGPVKDGGPAQRITTSIGAEREVTWSPDSKRLLYVTERGLDHLLAEYDVATGKETLLTRDGVAAAVAYAPDGKQAVYMRNGRELHVVTLGTTPADRTLFTGALSLFGDDTAPAFSPDGKWIAFPVTDSKSFTNISVVPVAGGAARAVSFLGNGQLGRVVWSPDGTFLLFDTGQRTEDSKIVRIDLVPHVPKYREDGFRKLFDKSAPAPKPDADPDDATDKTAKPGGKAGGKAAGKPEPKPAAKPVSIVFEGIRERASFLPLGLSAESPVISGDGNTLVFRATEKGQGNLYSYSLDELADDPVIARQVTATARPKGDFALSNDGKTLVYLDGGTLFASPLETPRPKAVGLAGEMDVNFATEKQVVFDEAWGMLDRDFFDPKFNGHDWKALRTRFQPYVSGARTGDELRRIINLMIGELNASHSGIGAPRGPGSAPREHFGDLGLRFDAAAYEAGKGLVVREVIPLGPAFIEGKIKPGDRLVSVDGVAITPATNLDQLLSEKVDERVVLGITGPAGARDAIVRPVAAATAGGLAYRAWVNARRAYVEKISGGRLGYVHMPDMSEESLNRLYLDLDAQNQSKQGVVVDIRNNNGGFVNGYALDVLARHNYLTMIPRDMFPIPARQALGQRALGLPTVLVTNESTLSDGEDFTEGYRTLGLGKVVGQPTAGWIIFTGGERMIDGSTVRRPGVRILGSKGDAMELNPRAVDIPADRPLGEDAEGRDAQLETAVKVLLGQ